jgi:hypothetical protein
MRAYLAERHPTLGLHPQDWLNVNIHMTYKKKFIEAALPLEAK